MPNAIVKPAAVTRQDVVFFDEGEDAGFRVGGSELRLPYEEAFRFAHLLRMHARRAKARAGDRSKQWTVTGVLEDMEAIQKRGG